MLASPYSLWATDWQPARPNGLTFIDIFCGAGGSAIGLTAAGYSLRLAANHWKRAIATHAANFTSADHLCADVNNYDMRRLPRAHVLWASPICWEASPAGGNHKPKLPGGITGQGDLLAEDDDEPATDDRWARTRATAYDVLRATEVWRFEAILIENVVEFATLWPLFWWWLEAFTTLGYHYKIVCVNSAHIGGDGIPYAPQWRNRMYIVLLPKGVPMPDLEPRPLAFCFDCGENVRARQTWKSTDQAKLRIGKFREQYLYTCPNTRRSHANPVVEPYVLPAAAALDLSDPGKRIGERRKPLAASTMKKIRAGLEMISAGPTAIQVNHGGHDGRHYPVWHNPLATRTKKGGDGVATPPMLVQVGGNTSAPHSAGLPLRTRMTRDTDAVITPPGIEFADALPPYLVEARGGGSVARPSDHPLATVTAKGNHLFLTTPDDRITWDGGHGLVIPYRRGEAKTTATPLHTVACKSSAALVQPREHRPIEEFHFRMLKAREHLRAQCFPDHYIVTGGHTDQTAQAGNAVSANVAQWLGQLVAQALGC
ncbi:DNA cytosine methyltransferase [Planomonospora parontospora]|uniref:DNA cytosine methyltransferase n=1 Tax=Planomonospora parontospora TaxID=58119 RepID=UPI00166F6D45|nr:DNA cytosine methyltransferase [Planomonospora parontospora]GGL48063.1 hypothetical protein GCM10014719_56680 [Planomonospora parontospora subsp. antibiotica]GII18790.1 hypothetical protein Ppa05_55160 [Planomonospora parontospora subsp. antibiotica]